MENSYPDSLKGHFLIAMPTLLDPNFAYTVTCICEHTHEGAVGIITNRMHSDITGKDIFEELNIDYVDEAAFIPIFSGGPVHINEIFVLHGPPFEWEGCLVITPFLAMSNTMDILRAVAKGKGPESVVITIGCAGWGPDQLEAEIRANAWLTCPVFEENIFTVAIDQRWENSVRKLGIDPAFLADTAGHA